MPDTAKDNKLRHGYRSLRIYEVKTDGTDSAKPVYGAPVTVRGNISAKLSESTDTDDIYADDSDYESAAGVRSYDIEVTYYGQASAEVERIVHGHETDADGNVVSGEDDNPGYFGMSWEVQGKDVDGNLDPEKVVLFRCQASTDYDLEDNTNEDKRSYRTNGFKAKATGMNFAGKKYAVDHVRKQTSEAAFARLETAMIDPTVKTVEGSGTGA